MSAAITNAAAIATQGFSWRALRLSAAAEPEITAFPPSKMHAGTEVGLGGVVDQTRRREGSARSIGHDTFPRWRARRKRVAACPPLGGDRWRTVPTLGWT